MSGTDDLVPSLASEAELRDGRVSEVKNGHLMGSSNNGTSSDVEGKMNQVLQENARLQAKLRGYQTLSHLFQEVKSECISLKKENQKLQDEKKLHSMNQNHSDKVTKVASPGNSAQKENESDGQNLSIGLQESLTSQGVELSGREPKRPDKGLGTFHELEAAGSTGLQPSQDNAHDDVKFGASYSLARNFSDSPSLFGSEHINGSISSLASMSQNPISMSVQVPGRASARESGLASEDREQHGGSPMSIHVADDLMNMIQKTKQLEQSERAWKAFAETLQTDLHETKTKLRMELESKVNTISILKGENLMLLQKIKKMEHERDALSPADSVSSETAVLGAEWVHVGKQQTPDPVTTGTGDDGHRIAVLEGKLQFLEWKNKQLSDANADWVAYRRLSETTQQERIQDLRDKLEASEKLLMDHRVDEEKRQCEIDKILMTSKRRCQELEDEMEELKFELNLSKNKCEELAEQLAQQQQQPLNQLSEVTSSRAPADVTPTTAPHLEEIVNEKEALKQQLTIFQEDFDKERADRAKAQTDRDLLQRQVAELAKQLKRTQLQLRTADESLQTTLSENERIQQQLSDVKRELKTSEDSLQKSLQVNDSLRRQLEETFQHLGRQEVVTPPQGGRPYYPPSPRHRQQQNWRGPMELYQTARVENAPELLPGSWQCLACTYVNYPGRSVCEVCGAVNQQQQQLQQQQRSPPYNPMAGSNDMPAVWTAGYGQQGLNQPNQDRNNMMRHQLISRGRFTSDDLTTDNGSGP